MRALSRMRSVFLWSAIATVMATAATLATSLSPAQNRRINIPSFDRDQAEVVADMLYWALLGREGDARGLAAATAEIQRGNVRVQVQSMIDSQEFRRGTARMSAAEILEQFYDGIHDREPDNTGVREFIERIRDGDYANVIFEMLSSQEFRNNLARETGRAPSGGGQRPAPQPQGPSRLEAALNCQMAVLEAVNDDVQGRAFITFDRMPETSQGNRVVSGNAVDRFDRDRQLSYRCEDGDASYSYADRRAPRGADIREPFPSVATRNCVDAASREFGGGQVQAAGLSATDTRTEYIIAVGVTNENMVRVWCEMDAARVVRVLRR